MNLKNIFIFCLLYYYLIDNSHITIIYYCGLIIFPLYCITNLVCNSALPRVPMFMDVKTSFKVFLCSKNSSTGLY